MSGESPKKTGRGYARNLDAGQFQPMIDSWDLHLRAERKSAKTVRTYLEAAQWFAAGYLLPAGLADWDEVRARHVQEWIITLLGRYSDCYANNQFRALQQFFKWHATEDPDEPRSNPMVSLKPPKVGDKLVPVFTETEIDALLVTCKGGGFQNRRDYAVISLFKDTGARLSELAGLDQDDVNPREREAVVTGKGDKQRTLRYTYDTARAIDRYLRERARHRLARTPALWLGVRGGPMTASGVYQVIERRGREPGVEVNPHKFRHTFSHNWLDNGGAEGDLMELNGWSSPQMLARYGRSVSSRTFAYLSYYTWRQVGSWLRRKHRRTAWKDLRRRYCGAGWWPASEERPLFNPAKVATTRYRYRGTAIPNPWPGQE